MATISIIARVEAIQGNTKNHPTDYILKKIIGFARNVTKLIKNVVLNKWLCFEI